MNCQIGEVEYLNFSDVSDLPDNIFKLNLPVIEEYISKKYCYNTKTVREYYV